MRLLISNGRKVDVDVGCTKYRFVSFMIVQAETSDELPEYLLGSIRVHKLRLEDAKSTNA